MTSFNKLKSSYEKLEKSDQLIVRVLSVVYEPVNQTTMNKILADVYRQEKQYRMLDLNVNKEMKYRLEARGLVEFNVDVRAPCEQCARSPVRATRGEDTLPGPLLFIHRFDPETGRTGPAIFDAHGGKKGLAELRLGET